MSYPDDDLRNRLALLADRAKPSAMSSERLLRTHRNRQVRRHATTVAAASAITAGGVIGGLRLVADRGNAAVLVPGSPTSSQSPTPTAADLGFNPDGPPPTCPDGQFPQLFKDGDIPIATGDLPASGATTVTRLIKAYTAETGHTTGFAWYSGATLAGDDGRDYAWIVTGPADDQWDNSVILDTTDGAARWAAYNVTFQQCVAVPDQQPETAPPGSVEQPQPASPGATPTS